jgi:Cu+-exporting ATPase
MSVGANSPHRSQHAGEDYLFCSAGCRAKFDANPMKYLAHTDRDASAGPGEAIPLAAPAAPAAPGTIYTCPMHPQIRQSGPGSCPICGMALEPLVPTATEDDSDLRAVKKNSGSRRR